MRIQSKNNETAKVRENAADQVVIGFITPFAVHLRKMYIH